MDRSECLIDPRKSRKEREVPVCGILLVTPVEAAYGHTELRRRGGEERFLYHSTLTVAPHDGLFVAGPAIGAPMAVLTLEKLIALGARKIILYGWCGALSAELKIGDLLLGGQPVSGEGTSQYYLQHGDETPGPDRELSRDLAHYLEERGLSPVTGTVWSTDAPYREKRQLLATLHDQQGVKAIDMEYSALCAASRFRNIQFSGLFMVSDELYHPEWRPGFGSAHFRNTSVNVVNTLLDVGKGGV